jgi:RHS repeat-associated protein
MAIQSTLTTAPSLSEPVHGMKPPRASFTARLALMFDRLRAGHRRLLSGTWLVALLCLLAGAANSSAQVPLDPELARMPVIERIVSAPVFEEPLTWVGDEVPGIEESEALWGAIDLMREHGPQLGFEALEVFLEEYPGSVWVPSLRSNLAKRYRELGRYTLALEHWELAWAETASARDPGGKQVADFTLAHWTRLLASLGRREQLALLLPGTFDRRLDGGPLQELFLATQEGFQRMVKEPEVAYRCGTLAVVGVGRALALPNVDLRMVMETPSPESGFSLSMLGALSAGAGLPLVPLLRPVGDERLVVPSVVHWRQNHYAALLEADEEHVYVVDPTFGDGRWLHVDVINAEASGYFLALSSQAPANWRRLTSAEAGQVYGRGYPTEFEDDDDENCPKGEGGDGEESDPAAPINAHDPNNEDDCEECPSSGGAGDGEDCDEDADCGTCDSKGLAVWNVSEPYLSLWVLDTPLYYTTSRGKRVAFTLNYRQRNSRPLNATWGMGPRWESSWLGYVRTDTYGGYVHLYPFHGGQRKYFAGAESSHYRSNSRMLPSSGSYLVRSSGGGSRTFAFAHAYYDGTTRYYPTQQIDRRGRITLLNHQLVSGIVRLNSIQDSDGNTISLIYSPSLPGRLVEVRDPYNRSAKLSYNANGELWKIEDVHGLTSVFTYGTSGRMTSLTTPYGTTTFAEVNELPFGSDNVANRSMLVTEPGGRKHFYIYRNNSEKLNDSPGAPDLLPVYYPAAEVPNTAPYANSLNNYGLEKSNSYYWGPNQYAALSAAFKTSENPLHLTLADYRLARSRNWLFRGTYSLQGGGVLNLERRPSPDGATPGQKIWYDYAGKVSGGEHWEGGQVHPQLIAMVLPNGTTRFTRYERNDWGRPTQVTSTYTTGGGIGLRTTTYNYDSDGRKLLSIVGPDGQTRVAYTYDTTHPGLIKTVTRYHAAGQGYTTTYYYNASGRLTSRVDPAGLTTTYTYSSGWLTGISDSPVTRSESFTYDLGNLRTHTDYLGLTRTFTWDHLSRLTRIDYSSDSTYETFGYTALDQTSHRDRRGKISTSVYNGLRQLVSKTDPLARTTTYTYCECGSLASITDPLSQVTSFTYDYNGRRTQVQLPGGQTVTYTYDLPGHLIGATDALGTWTATYNNQGLLATVRNPANQVHLNVTYDIDDDPVSVTGPNGVAVTRAFDYFGRVKTRKQGTQPNESFNYSARGLISHTDQLGKITQFAYDQARRKTSETTPNNETVNYTYNAGGNPLTLTDHRGKVTTWTYDVEGRMRTKKYHGQSFANLEYTYNPNSQVATRKFWSNGSTSRTTTYGYDDVGNLTSITYPAGTPNVSYTHDALNRIVSMTDAIGTSTFGYTSAGLASFEQPPWTKSKITFGYNSALLRSSLSLEQPTGSWTQSYGYNSSRRLTSLTAPSLSATPFAYTYLGASRQVSQVTFPTGAKVVNSYDALARLSATRLRRQDNTILNKHEYVYNNRNERTKHTRTDNSYVNFGYDNLGQLTSALGYLSGGSPIANEQLGYGYDGGWNMTQRTVNGSPTSYTVNDRNQVTAIGASETTVFDANGNLISRFNSAGPNGLTYVYDDENRLVAVHTDTYYTPSASRWKTEWVYDGLSRARIRKEYYWYTDYEVWALSGEVRYLYDGRRVIQERNSGNTPTVTYTRGPDLSGSFEGAGGIGGLLARSHGYSSGNWTSHNFYHADGGGNITSMVNNHASAAAVVASYRYDPFGRTLSQSGTMAAANVYRFSSKEIHVQSGMYGYGFRFYDPTLQRWLNRDPIFEAGGINLYGFVRNQPTRRIDPFGLDYYEVAPPWCGGSDIPYYYGDTLLEDLRALPYNTGAALVNTLEGVTAFGQWALGRLLGDEHAAEAMVLFLARQPARLTSRAARRQAMRNADIPTSRPAASQSGNVGRRQYVVDGADGKPRVVTQHPADKQHPNPHWHASKPKVDDAGNMRCNNHGQVRFEPGSTVEY